jgi:hypothetical protein
MKPTKAFEAEGVISAARKGGTPTPSSALGSRGITRRAVRRLDRPVAVGRLPADGDVTAAQRRRRSSTQDWRASEARRDANATNELTFNYTKQAGGSARRSTSTTIARCPQQLLALAAVGRAEHVG